jgi:hypothetical protein
MSRRIRSARLRRGLCARIFFEGEFGAFAGGFAKIGGKTWCFDGQFVVKCEVNVVSWRTLFKIQKMRHGL